MRTEILTYINYLPEIKLSDITRFVKTAQQPGVEIVHFDSDDFPELDKFLSYNSGGIVILYKGSSQEEDIKAALLDYIGE